MVGSAIVSPDFTPWDEFAGGGLVRAGVDLAPLTTYKFGGPARYYAEVETSEHLGSIVGVLAEHPIPVLVLGRGSNLVISDEGFPGLVLRLGGTFLRVSIHDDGVVSAGSAVPLPRLARAAVKAGRGGLEFFVGIPGSVGGAVQMNAGCHGSETAEWLIEASIIDLASGGVRHAGPEALDLRYRHSNLAGTDLVIGARFRTVERTPPEGAEILREITQWRKEHQPGGTFNAGSVFKNPPDDAAGRIIDAAGLKGYRRGGVFVSERHANFFVAESGASAQDVYDLVHDVRVKVAAIAGVELEPEVRFAGPFREPS